MTETLKCGDC